MNRNLRPEQIELIRLTWERGELDASGMARALQCPKAQVQELVTTWEKERIEKGIAEVAEEASEQGREPGELYWARYMAQTAEKWSGQTRTIVDKNGLAGYSIPRQNDDNPRVIGTFGERI